ncbi:Mannosyl oligosaccharide glucosidase, putative [Leishmania donovani]|uniref:Mannosyl-oligosaccharide glucosidase n=1 Tax=Leishmania donovani TaxID=5661 RepID=A0A3Q8IB45_LEIDO|nr:Mannosyl oligosaccharide glucosidase, putative [Leishmania donovani]
MRDRRPLLRKDAETAATELSMPAETAQERYQRAKKREAKDMQRGALSYLLFILVFLGVPLLIVAYCTPFFVLQNLRCRLQEKYFWPDTTVRAMEDGYTRYFNEPPLYPSTEYNRTMMWGTYEPSRIFAVKSRSLKPVTVGIAWYDSAMAHPLRHTMPYLHNKVSAPRTTQKKGIDAEVMQVKWVVNDGLHYAKEVVEDRGNKVSLEIELLKSPFADAWHVRIHARVESDSPLVMVVYMSHADTQERIELEAPTEHNDGDWSPVLKSRMQPEGKTEHTDFTLRVHDDHSPLHDTAPWHVYGLHTDVEAAFQRKAVDAVGTTPAERAAAGGRGIGGGVHVGELQQQQLDLRRLPESAFTYIQAKDPQSFRTPPSWTSHNVMILRKSYDSSFRLELSLSPADHARGDEAPGASTTNRIGNLVPRYEALSTCQLTNALRWRSKAISLHSAKIFRPFLRVFNSSKDLYERIATVTLAEMLGSLTFTSGHYLHVGADMDDAWDQQGRAEAMWGDAKLQASRQRVSAIAVVGSRTDEAFGQPSLTGLPLLFLTRWNKEVVKDILASWLLGAQDAETGFVPNRAVFGAETRSFTPQALRYEHPTLASPPTLLLGLHGLLKEMSRKSARLATANHRKPRNTPEYLERERAADEAFLRVILPALKRWRKWWHHTQCGGATDELARQCRSRKPLEEWPLRPAEDQPESLLVYRWRGRDGHRLPTSGMEDYPRPICAGEHHREAHVDAFSWVALLSTLISRIETEFLHEAESVSLDWEAHLNAVHWDAAEMRYSDRIGCSSWTHTPYFGYANLYPVMLGVVRQNLSRAARTIALAQRELESDYGLMSVSFSSVRLARESGLPHHNMWMGYVWPSANLIFLYGVKSHYLEALDSTSAAAGGLTEARLRDFYTSLRVNVIETIRGGSRWWEHYSPLDGRGEGSKTHIATRSLLLGLLDDFA